MIKEHGTADSMSADERKAMVRKLVQVDEQFARSGSETGRVTVAPGLPRWARLALAVQTCGLLCLGWYLVRTPEPVRPAADVAPTAKPGDGAADGRVVPGAKLEASGFVIASRTATVSARVMGQVASMPVQEGQQVRAGQLLAKINDIQARTELQLAVAQEAVAGAQVRTAQTQLREAQRNLERELALNTQGFSSEARVSKARAEEDTARSALDSARGQLALAGLQTRKQRELLDEYVVRAPFEGLVVALNAQVGELVAPSAAGGGYTRTGICTIVDMSTRKIAVDINEEMITRIRPGQEVEAELYSYKGWRFRARVLRLMPTADRAKATVRVIVQPLTDDARILPDMAVKVWFL